jgi:hypothetical protein
VSEALVEKLLRTGHLSVPERRALGAARWSVISTVVERGLAASGWFPAPLVEDGEHAAIERSKAGFVVHEQHEIGVGRFGPVEQRSHATLGAAIDDWLAASRIEHGIDGVPIDRDR